MKSKYYTPSIEEFHVGFEYEVKLNNGNWDKHSLNVLSELNFESKSITENNVRVKYLDKEDIEECGWKKNGTKYTLSIYSLRFAYDNLICIYEHSGNTFSSIFLGKIKNKSEFKILLKQLGIISETKK